MTSDIAITTDTGSSVGLQRWLDALRAAMGGSVPSESPQRADGVARPARTALDRSLDRSRAADERTLLRGAGAEGRRVSAAALDAHAAWGELEVQRAGHAAVERTLARNIADLALRWRQTEPREGAQAASFPAGGGSASRPVAGDAPRPSAGAHAREAVHGEVTRELALGRARFDQLRTEALEAARAASARVVVLAEAVAGENRRVQQDRRALPRARVEHAAPPKDIGTDVEVDVEAARLRDRRDAAIREISRLTGASATSRSDGSIDIEVGGVPIVSGTRAYALEVRRLAEAATEPEAGRPPSARDAIGPNTPVREVESTLASRGERPAEARPLGTVTRLVGTDGRIVEHPGGALAAHLDAVDRIVPVVLARWEGLAEIVRRTDPLPGSGAGRRDPDAVSTPVTTAREMVEPVEPVEQVRLVNSALADRWPRVPEPIAVALADIEAALTGRAAVAERRLDVLSVVDAVLVGAPVSQLGGLVSTALGGVAAATGRTGAHSAQERMTALQAVHMAAVGLGATAADLIADGAAVPLVFVSSDAARVSVSRAPIGRPDAGAHDGPGRPEAAAPVTSAPCAGAPAPAPQGSAGRLWPWVASLAPAAAPPAATDPPVPRASVDPGRPASVVAVEADVTVLELARAGSVATRAALPAGAMLGGGAPLVLGVTTAGPAESARRTLVEIPGPARLGDVAGAINASAAPVHASVVSVASSAGPAERLVLTSDRTGSGRSIEVSDGYLPGRRVDALGAFARLDAGSDTVLRVVRTGDTPGGIRDGIPEGSVGTPARGAAPRPSEGERALVLTSATNVVDGALPGVRLTVHDVARSVSPATGPFGPSRTDGTDGVPGGERVPAGDPGPVRVSATPDAATAATHAASLVAGAAAVVDTIRGRGSLAGPVAATLTSDEVVETLAARVVSAFTGGADAGDDARPGSDGGSTGAGPHDRPLPGVTLRADDVLRFDRRAFVHAFDADAAGVEARVHLAARELTDAVGHATDPRAGLLAARIVTVPAAGQEYDESAGDVDGRGRARREALAHRAEGLTSLLDRLGDQQRWLVDRLG